jgi:hypothetical protein
MKQLFLRAADDLDPPRPAGSGPGARRRRCGDLLRMRGALVAALREEEALALAERAELYHRLDRGPRRATPLHGLGALPALPEAWQVWSAMSRRRGGAPRPEKTGRRQRSRFTQATPAVEPAPLAVSRPVPSCTIGG